MAEILQLVQLDRVVSVLKRVPDGPPIHGVEVGVMDGKFSAAMLFMRPYLTLLMVDRWKVFPPGEPTSDPEVAQFCSQAAMDAFYTKAMERTQPYHLRRQVAPMESTEAASMVPPASCDFVFIDANHTYEAVVTDIGAWRHKVKPGGWLCGHDYGREAIDRPRYRVSRAVDEYVRQHGLTLETDAGHTWFVRLGEKE